MSFLNFIVNFTGTLIWPAVTAGIFYILRHEISAIIKRFSSADELEVSVGSLSIQAKAMREIHDSVITYFPESTLNKKELKALIDTKIRSIQSAMEHKLTNSSIRSDARVIAEEQIIITSNDGKELQGETLDVSEAGIGFKSPGRLRFHEIVKISAPKSNKQVPILDQAMIVRIDQSDEGFHYGAKIPDPECA